MWWYYNGQTIRQIFGRGVCEGGVIGFVPTYGNTLMGLARHHPFGPENDYSIAYYASAQSGLESH